MIGSRGREGEPGLLPLPSTTVAGSIKCVIQPSYRYGRTRLGREWTGMDRQWGTVGTL